MDKDLKDIIIVMAVTLIVIGGIVGGLFVYSGMNSPLTVIESGSMQHSDDKSQIGVIDTGDMVVMVNPNKTTVTTYVEGYQNGYMKFGEYGDVIIYYRDTGNPVIHRAMLWIDYNGDGTWSAPSLANYPEDRWVVNNDSHDYMSMTGTLTFFDVGYKHGTFSLSFNSMDSHSGYLTKGDHNPGFDQPSAWGVGLVQKSDIKAVAGLEVPWLGCIKLYSTGTNINYIPSNSVPCLIVAIIDIIAFFIVIAIAMDCLFTKVNDKRKIRNE